MIEKLITIEEIKALKIDFVNSIMQNRIFKSRGELIERLKMYRELYAIRDETERLVVNSMITDGTSIPDELLEQKVEIHETYECPYFCPSCSKRMYDWRTFPRTTYGRTLISSWRSAQGYTKKTEFEMRHIRTPKEYEVVCLNINILNEKETLEKGPLKCSRYGLLIDIEIVKNSMKDNHGNLNLNLSRSEDGKFKSNK